MYNPQKPTKWGLHIYVTVDSTNGCVCGLNLLWVNNYKMSDNPELTFTKIVLELLEKVQNVTHEKWYHLYTDRYYINMDLGRQLLKQKFICQELYYKTENTCPHK